MIKLSKDKNVVSSFIPGDFVVYPSHGVGKIIGTENRKVEDIELEFNKKNLFSEAVLLSTRSPLWTTALAGKR